MAEFEEACAELGIPLIVLPPKKPKYNGGVERSNRTFREEFYARRDILADSVGAFNAEIKAMVQKYNTHRPHSALKGLTPHAVYSNYPIRALFPVSYVMNLYMGHFQFAFTPLALYNGRTFV